MTVATLASLRETPGLDAYLDELEERLERAVAAYPGIVSEVGAEALSAGGKRLRPLLVFLATQPDAAPSVEAGVAVELVHMATLVHDDLIDGAEFRRGRAAAWSAYGPDAARAAGDYLFARAFSELANTGDRFAIGLLAQATLCLARGEAMQRLHTHDPSTTVESYLERCALKTGKLFEAACLLGAGTEDGGLGEFGAALGIAFQVTDDILDCAGESVDTGKGIGTDLREGTPTLPLIYAAREDEVVCRALAGGPVDGALVRIAATGALDRAREVARAYASRARASLNHDYRREELEALTYVVVERQR
jgi:geranylgeranyl pyrophosphate synthase